MFNSKLKEEIKDLRKEIEEIKNKVIGMVYCKEYFNGFGCSYIPANHPFVGNFRYRWRDIRKDSIIERHGKETKIGEYWYPDSDIILFSGLYQEQKRAIESKYDTQGA